jgi:ATP-dependent protease ClpP protease subunit
MSDLWADWAVDLKGDGKDTDCLSNLERLEQLGEFFLVGEVTEKRCHELTAAMLRRAKEAVEGGKECAMTLHISTCGGSASAGFALGAAVMTIRAQGIPVRTHIKGQAHSMGLIIAQFGQKRVMDALATVHIHDVSWGEYGDTRRHADAQRHIEMLRDYACGVYASRNTRGGVRSDPRWWRDHYMSGGDYYFSAGDALAEGLVDELSGGYPIA